MDTLDSINELFEYLKSDVSKAVVEANQELSHVFAKYTEQKEPFRGETFSVLVSKLSFIQLAKLMQIVYGRCKMPENEHLLLNIYKERITGIWVLNIFFQNFYEEHLNQKVESLPQFEARFLKRTGKNAFEYISHQSMWNTYFECDESLQQHVLLWAIGTYRKQVADSIDVQLAFLKKKVVVF